MEKNVIDWIALVLVIIGGLNWGLTALGYNVVDSLLGVGIVSKIVYYLVGIAALYMIYFLFKE